MKNNTRREFITKSSAAAAGVSVGLHAFGSRSTSKVFGANDKIKMGFIGIGNRGSQLLNIFMANKDCEIAALCDVYEPYTTRKRKDVDKRFLDNLGKRIPKMGEKFEKQPKIYKDYRDLLADKDIDAVCIATPDHWHALQTIHSIQASKDVYVEKPLTQTIFEGRKMVEVQAASNQVVSVGLNRRGSITYQKLVKEIASGKIGKVSAARAARISNLFPNGIGKMSAELPPKGFDWDMWLGPRGIRPFQYNMAPYYFRWWSDFSSQMGNWGVHYMDVIRWMVGETAPTAISAHGGKFVLDHDGDIPDTMQVCFEFASGFMISFNIYEGNSGRLFEFGELELMGTKGNVFANEKGYKIIPSKAGQFQDWKTLLKAEEYERPSKNLEDGSSADSTATLIRDFLDCVKSRKTPLCTLEEGHRSTSFAHLANIALATKERLQWDAKNEKFTNSKVANELLHYNYRKPWKL